MIELVLVGVALAATAILATPLALRFRLGLAAALAVVPLAFIPLLPDPVQAPAALPTDRTAATDYVASRACRACHPDAYASWHRSFHRTMTQVASPATVLADWRGTLRAGERTYTLRRDGDRFLVDMPAYGTDGTADRVEREVVMTTGSHHMQVYWTAVPWSEAAPAKTGRQVYNERCGPCHGIRGGGTSDGPRLLGAQRTPSELRRTLDRHGPKLDPPLEPRDRADIATYVERLQLEGELQQVPFVWWIADGRWVHEDATFLQPASDPDGEEPYEQVWNNACDTCHSVAPAVASTSIPSVDGAAAELGIACEACHGPGQEHVERQRNPATRYLTRMGAKQAGGIVNPAKLPPDRASAICGQCHAELQRLGTGAFQPGSALDGWAHLTLPLDPQPPWLADALEVEPELLDWAFWDDGTIRVAGRDLNGLAVSPCALEGGVSCLTCHTMHHAVSPDGQLRPGADGDAPCLECHADNAGTAHTHHPEASEGSRCMSCHMPRTTLGLLTAMRSHRIDSPDVDGTRPDACTLCHLDRPHAWLQQAMARLWGVQPKVRPGDDERSRAIELLVRGDAAQRAVVAWHLGWEPARQASGGDWQPGLLAYSLDDPYAAVRAIAGDALHRNPGFEDLDIDWTLDEGRRGALVAEVLARWPGAEPRPTVLIGPDGRVTEQIELLELLRNDREVVVSE